MHACLGEQGNRITASSLESVGCNQPGWFAAHVLLVGGFSGPWTLDPGPYLVS